MRSSRAAVVLAAAVAALAAAALVAGCGGSGTVSKAEYADTVVNTRDRVDFALAQVTVGQGTLDELIGRLRTASQRIDEAAGDLEGAGVAKGFEAETEQLVAALRQLAVDLDATAADASQPGMEGLLTGANALQSDSWNEANRILADLADQGIRVTPIGSH